MQVRKYVNDRLHELQMKLRNDQLAGEHRGFTASVSD